MIWAGWVYTQVTSGTTAITTIDPWYQWNADWLGTTGATGTTNGIIWDGWNQTYSVNVPVEWNVTTTPEQLEAARVAAEERAKRIKEADEEQARRRAEIAAKARALLLSVLDEDQQQELEKVGHFHVHTKDGLRSYRLRPGSGPVRVKSEDGFQYSYCIHPPANYPADDTAVAQKLLLETDEESFLEIANGPRLGPVPVPVAT